jgi:hypothetical protein
MINLQRSHRFAAALMALSDRYDPDIRITLIDLLADARHWCDRTGKSFALFGRQAYQHYLAERNHSERTRP